MENINYLGNNCAFIGQRSSTVRRLSLSSSWVVHTVKRFLSSFAVIVQMTSQALYLHVKCVQTFVNVVGISAQIVKPVNRLLFSLITSIQGSTTNGSWGWRSSGVCLPLADDVWSKHSGSVISVIFNHIIGNIRWLTVSYPDLRHAAAGVRILVMCSKIYHLNGLALPWRSDRSIEFAKSRKKLPH